MTFRDRSRHSDGFKINLYRVLENVENGTYGPEVLPVIKALLSEIEILNQQLETANVHLASMAIAASQDLKIQASATPCSDCGCDCE